MKRTLLKQPYKRLQMDKQHWTKKHGCSWKAKVTYESEDEAWEFLNQHPKLVSIGYTAYRCRICNKFHIGHKDG